LNQALLDQRRSVYQGYDSARMLTKWLKYAVTACGAVSVNEGLASTSPLTARCHVQRVVR